MNITSSLLLSLILDNNDLNHLNIHSSSYSNRHLQTLPEYTSPPTIDAIEATPVEYRDDSVIDDAREAAAAGLCSTLDPGACQILFPPSKDFDSRDSPSLGVLFYGGALVDPRSYSPIAKELSEHYGLAVSIPIFKQDVAFEGCTSDRLELARRAYPSVKKWIMTGHSMGGIGVMSEVWTAATSSGGKNDGGGEGYDPYDLIGGFVLIASYVRQDVGCGAVDFSKLDIPAASVIGQLDGVVNIANWENGQNLLSQENTLFISIPGGNHGNFGSYDYSGRKITLGQNDGNATIPKNVQQNLATSAILHAVSRGGMPLPQKAERKKATGGKKKGPKRK